MILCNLAKYSSSATLWHRAAKRFKLAQKPEATALPTAWFGVSALTISRTFCTYDSRAKVLKVDTSKSGIRLDPIIKPVDIARIK